MIVKSHIFVDRPVSKIQVGELFSVTNVKATNVTYDLLEYIKNIFGGKMKKYSELLDEALNECLKEILNGAKENGYDGIVNLRVSNPNVVDGGVEIILYGNGFNYT